MSSTEPDQEWQVALRLPEEWITVDTSVLSDQDLLATLGIDPAAASAVDPDDVIVLAILSEVLESEADPEVPAGALIASLVAVLAPPAAEGSPDVLRRRRALAGLPEGEEAWVEEFLYRVPMPQINSDLLLQFGTPNLPLLEDLEGLFGRIAATAECRAG